MAEVATRTSKGGVLDGVEKNASGNFDVRSWKGLTEILKAARASKMDEGEYAAFRDTVLQYAQGGGSDVALRKKIEETAAKFKVALPVHEERPQTPVEPKPIQSSPVVKADTTRPFAGTVRPSPRFAAPAAPVSAPSASKPAPVPTAETLEKKNAVPDNLPIAKPAVKDVPEFVKRPVITDGEAISIKKITPESAEGVQPSPSGIKTVEEYRARIAEIKRTVNAQVGNPITLMDGDNAIGREYMQALLGAMKAVSGAAPGTLQSSMEQLEKVFARVSALPTQAVNETPKQPSPEVKPPEKVEETRNAGSEPNVQPRTEVRHAPAPTPDRRPSSAPIASMRTPQVPRLMDTAPTQVSTPKPSVPQTPKPPVAERPVVSPQQSPQAQKPTKASHAIPSLADALKNAGIARTPERTEPVSEKVVQTPSPTPQAPAQTVRPQSSAPRTPPTAPQKALPNVLKIGETSPVVNAMGKHTAKGVGRSGFDATVEGDTDHPVPAGVREDPHSPEVDEGLKQLLHEWSIFRGGGLFGTGPSGMEHPLWEKLAPLPMSIVAAGTWEGASKEAILSIRDYINGWRHEQGVSYIQTESFESYLRRVVKRILKRVSG